MEYAVLLACIAAALLGMQYYVKRSVQGRAKQAADELGDPYDSENMNISNMTTRVDSLTVINSKIDLLPDTTEKYYVESNISINETTNKTGSEDFKAWSTP